MPVDMPTFHPLRDGREVLWVGWDVACFGATRIDLASQLFNFLGIKQSNEGVKTTRKAVGSWGHRYRLAIYDFQAPCRDGYDDTAEVGWDSFKTHGWAPFLAKMGRSLEMCLPALQANTDAPQRPSFAGVCCRSRGYRYAQL